jgi:hypothetical protein
MFAVWDVYDARRQRSNHSGSNFDALTDVCRPQLGRKDGWRMTQEVEA